MVETKRDLASTATYCPTSLAVNMGVITTARNVLAAVMSTDKATLPRARYVTTLLAVPPGQHATKHSPAAYGAGRFKALLTKAPAVGITVYCKITPARSSLGMAMAPLKSSREIVIPIPSIVMLSPMICTGPWIHVNAVGRIIPAAHAAATHSGNPDDNASPNSSIRFPNPPSSELAIADDDASSSGVLCSFRLAQVVAPFLNPNEVVDLVKLTPLLEVKNGVNLSRDDDERRELMMMMLPGILLMMLRTLFRFLMLAM